MVTKVRTKDLVSGSVSSRLVKLVKRTGFPTKPAGTDEVNFSLIVHKAKIRASLEAGLVGMLVSVGRHCRLIISGTAEKAILVFKSPGKVIV